MIGQMADNRANMLAYRIFREIASNTAHIFINNITQDIAILLFNILAIQYEYEIGVS